MYVIDGHGKHFSLIMGVCQEYLNVKEILPPAISKGKMVSSRIIVACNTFLFIRNLKQLFEKNIEKHISI